MWSFVPLVIHKSKFKFGENYSKSYIGVPTYCLIGLVQTKLWSTCAAATISTLSILCIHLYVSPCCGVYFISLSILNLVGICNRQIQQQRKHHHSSLKYTLNRIVYCCFAFPEERWLCQLHWLLYNFDFADSDSSLYIVHIVPFVCCIIHVSSILVDCCMTYIILEKSLLKYCAHWLLYNFDFADSDLSLYIVHIVPFVCCIINVSSILVDCCIDIYHIGSVVHILIVAYYHHLCIYRIHVLPNQTIIY